MNGTDALVYLDTSGLVKLTRPELETRALLAFLRTRANRCSSVLAAVELRRAAIRVDPRAARRAPRVLSGLLLLPLDDGVIATAGSLQPPALRSLDAIHLATALSLGDSVESFVTYDVWMQQAARAAGLNVAAPA